MSSLLSLFHHSDQFDFVFLLRCIDWVRKPLCEPNFYVFFVLRIILGPNVKFVQWKAFNPRPPTPRPRPPPPSPVVYTTDCSKAVAPMSFLFCVALQFTLRGVSCLVLPCSLSLCFFCPLAFWSPCLGERKLVFVLIVHLFVSYAHVNLCHFFSSSWCRGLAAASACGSSWTFLLTFFQKTFIQSSHFQKCINLLQIIV